MGARSMAESRVECQQAPASHCVVPSQSSDETPETWPEHICLLSYTNTPGRVQFDPSDAGKATTRNLLLKVYAHQLQSSQIMPQLLFHGKQTQPREIRRDHWRPYFSIHFPETPAGTRAGLVSYQRLREFSLRRQLDPEIDTLRTTPKGVVRYLKTKGDPGDVFAKLLYETEERKKLKLPKVGSLLPLKSRSKRLQQQKATSVADASFVLNLAADELRATTIDELKDRTADRLRYLLGRKGKRRLKAVRAEEAEKENEIEALMPLAHGAPAGSVGIDRKTASSLATEFGGRATYDGHSGAISDMRTLEKRDEQIDDLSEYERRLNEIAAAPEADQQGLRNELAKVEMHWADMQDALYAETWPASIEHVELAPEALTRIGDKVKWSPHTMPVPDEASRIQLAAEAEYKDIETQKEFEIAAQRKSSGSTAAEKEHKAAVAAAKRIFDEQLRDLGADPNSQDTRRSVQQAQAAEGSGSRQDQDNESSRNLEHAKRITTQQQEKVLKIWMEENSWTKAQAEKEYEQEVGRIRRERIEELARVDESFRERLLTGGERSREGEDRAEMKAEERRREVEQRTGVAIPGSEGRERRSIEEEIEDEEDEVEPSRWQKMKKFVLRR